MTENGSLGQSLWAFKQNNFFKMLFLNHYGLNIYLSIREKNENTDTDVFQRKYCSVIKI